MAMFLHLVADEKFIDGAVDRFRKNDPGNHTFVYLSPNKEVSFSYIKHMDAIRIVQIDSPPYERYLLNHDGFTAVFVHGLISPHLVEFVNRADKGTIIIWLFWGAELWGLKKYRTSAYLPFTKALYYKHSSSQFLEKVLEKTGVNLKKYSKMFLRSGVSGTFKVIFRKFFNSKGHHSCSLKHDSDPEKAMHRADYIIPVVKEDFLLLKKKVDCKAEFLDWNYSLGLPLKKMSNLSTMDRNILVGNSAHYTNNHLEIFVKLKKYRNLFDKAIVPLSYGDERYKKSVLRAGELLLKESFSPLLGFLPVQQYFECVGSCHVAIFNSRRQQALGNIAMSLYLGAKVFLREENPIYRFLKKRDITLFTIENDLDGSTLMHSLSSYDKQRNKKTIQNLYSEENLDKKTKTLIRFLNNTQSKASEE